MIKAPKKPEDVKDEPGAEERFMRGVKRALNTPPKPQDQLKAERKGKEASPKKGDQEKSPGRPKNLSQD